MYITVVDVNDNAPAFQYPVYPVVSTLPNRNFYITALSLFSDTAATPLIITVSVLLDRKYEPPRDKTNKMASAPSEDSGQPGHL